MKNSKLVAQSALASLFAVGVLAVSEPAEAGKKAILFSFRLRDVHRCFTSHILRHLFLVQSNAHLLAIGY